MKKVVLGDNESIQIKVKFGKRILFFDSFVIIMFLVFNQSLNPSKSFHLLFSILFIVGIISPMVIFTLLNIIRLVSQRVYLTNFHLYSFKGFLLKRIHTIPFSELSVIKTRATLFDRRMGLMSIQIVDIHEKKFILKGVKNNKEVIDYLALQIIENSKKSQSE